MRKYKTKVIRADLGIFTHILAYSDISRYIQRSIIKHIQTHLEPCVTLTYSEPKPWYIHNPGIFRILVYPEPWHI